MSALNGKPLPFECYFDSKVDKYLVKDASGLWMPLNRSDIRLLLIEHGFDPDKPGSGRPIAPVDRAILRIQKENHILYSGPLAGYKSGRHLVNNTPILVTQSPVVIESKKGEWSTLRKLHEGLFGPDDHHRQRERWYAYIKVSDNGMRNCMERGNVTYGQTAILAGPRNCGKSLEQQLYTHMLGGRVANPFGFMSGKTQFNRELFAAEHLMIEDEQPFSSHRDRAAFGDAIKQISATRFRPCYGKNREAITLAPLWRLTISANEDSLEVLPVFEESLKDKVLVFRCFPCEMPMPVGTAEEKEAFFDVLLSELPAFMHWIREEFVIPEEIADPSRYGVKAFIHDSIQAMLDDLSSDRRVLSLVDHVLFQDKKDLDRPWVGTAETLVKLCWDSPNYQAQAKAIIRSPISLAKVLSRLSKPIPSRISLKRSKLCNTWTIHAPIGVFPVDGRPVEDVEQGGRT